MPTCAIPTGILQLVFDEDTPKDVFAKAESLKSEYVVICRGKLRERAAKTDKIATGDVEFLRQRTAHPERGPDHAV